MIQERTQEVADLREALQRTDGKLGALEEQIGKTEVVKQLLETKLSQIHSSLRRLLGFRQAPAQAGQNVRLAMQGPPSRSRSPSRRAPSPTRDGAGSASFHYFNLPLATHLIRIF